MPRKRRTRHRGALIAGAGFGMLSGFGLDQIPTVELAPVGYLVAVAATSPSTWFVIRYRKRLKKWFTRRWGFVYLARTWHPTSRLNRISCGYVGQSIRRIGVRWDEHEHGYWWGGQWKPPQPWADTLVEWRIICQPKRRLGLTLDFLEWLHIQLRIPLYNVEMNRSNPRRIRPETARAQRAWRDERVGAA